MLAVGKLYCFHETPCLMLAMHLLAAGHTSLQCQSAQTLGSGSATSSLSPTCRRACCRPPCRSQPLCSRASQHSSSQQEWHPAAASCLPDSSTSSSRTPPEVGVGRHQAPSCCRPGKPRVRQQRPCAQRGGQQLTACRRVSREAAAASPTPRGAPGQEAAPAGGSW